MLGQLSNKIVFKVENEIITNYDIKNKILSNLILIKSMKLIKKILINLKESILKSLIQFKT